MICVLGSVTLVGMKGMMFETMFMGNRTIVLFGMSSFTQDR